MQGAYRFPVIITVGVIDIVVHRISSCVVEAGAFAYVRYRIGSRQLNTNYRNGHINEATKALGCATVKLDWVRLKRLMLEVLDLK